MYDMSLTEEQAILQQNIREFTREVVAPRAKEVDITGEFPWDVINKVIAMELHCMPIPEKFGGPGLDSVTSAILLEELAKGCAGMATTIAANGLTSYPVLLAGNEEQQKMYFDILYCLLLLLFLLCW